MGYLFLILAIFAELLGTTLIKSTDGFTKLMPTIATLLSYGVAFYFLSLVVKTIPVNIAYAIWGGLGVIIITLITVFIFKQPINIPTIIGILLITIGVVIVNLFGTSH